MIIYKITRPNKSLVRDSAQKTRLTPQLERYILKTNQWTNMKTLNSFILIFTLFMLCSFSAYAGTEQKMIIVKGQNSYLMDGDEYGRSHNKPRNYRKNEVLPALLSIGWRIKNINVNEKSTEDNLYGYVLLEITN